MTKIICVIFSIILLICLFGCTDSSLKDPKLSSNDLTEKELNKLLNEKIPQEPFLNIEESASPLSDDEIKDIINEISTKKYDVYPNLHNIPLAATLYKYGEVISIDIRDPRLIRLINFFNNSLFYEKCEYSLSHLDQDDLEDIMSDEFRLELKYEPYGENVPTAYENQPTLFDTIVVHGGLFALINNDFPWYYGDELIPFKGNYYLPYGMRQPSGWLELFGF